MKNWIKTHKKLCIAIGVAIVVVIIGAVAYTTTEVSTSTASQETTTVERRTLLSSVSATGSFIASEEDKLTSDAVGSEVLAVNVSVGDTVAEGDTICVIDTESLQEQLQNLQDAKTSAAEQIASNKASAAANITAAAAQRDEAIANLDASIESARLDWVNAQAVADASAAAAERAETDGTSTTDLASLQRQALIDQNSANAYKNTYDTLVSNRATSVSRIESTYSSTVSTNQAIIDATDDTSATYDEQITELSERIASATVKATRSGLITSVSVEVGDNYTGGTIATIDNVDAFDVTVEIGEYDINSIVVGQEVVIKSNATGDEELAGTVKSVSPIATGSEDSEIAGFDVSSLLDSSSLTSLSGSSDDVTYTVKISVDETSELLRIGMTAKVNIILARSEDVLSVPYTAVGTDDDGDYYVTQVTGTDDDGNYVTKRVAVTKGIESDYYTEIINSGLSEGDEILLPETETGQTLEDLIQSSPSNGGIS